MNLESKAATIQLTSTLISGVKNTRTYFGVQNVDSTNNVFIHFGEGAATTLNGIKVEPDEYLEIDPGFPHNQIINAIATGAPVNIVFLE